MGSRGTFEEPILAKYGLHSFIGFSTMCQWCSPSWSTHPIGWSWRLSWQGSASALTRVSPLGLFPHTRPEDSLPATGPSLAQPTRSRNSSGFRTLRQLADPHLCALRVNLTPENYTGRIEVRSGLNGEADNLGVKHWGLAGAGSCAATLPGCIAELTLHGLSWLLDSV